MRRPDGDGAAEARGAPRVPIVALTASALEGDAQRCLDVGMDAYLSKPVRQADLCAALRRWAVPASADRRSQG